MVAPAPYICSRIFADVKPGAIGYDGARQAAFARHPVEAPMTHYSQADLDLATRHLAEGEVRIARQQALIVGMRARNLPTAIAEKLLAEFRYTLSLQREHHAAIADALERAGG